MEDLKEKKIEYARVITLMDIERIKLMEAKKYHVLVEGFVKEMLPQILGVEEYTKMKKEQDISIMIGEYMGETDMLYGKKEGEK
jgi:hypothetical protein